MTENLTKFSSMEMKVGLHEYYMFISFFSMKNAGKCIKYHNWKEDNDLSTFNQFYLTCKVRYIMTLLRKPKIWTFNTQTRIDCSSKRGCYSEMIAYSYSQYTNKDNHLWFNFEIFWEEICHLRTHLCLRHQNEEQIFGLWHGLVFIHTGSEANNLIHAKWACLSNCPF